MSEISNGSWTDEGFLSFQFPAPWRVWKWDDEPAYRNWVGKLPESHAVDFVGLRAKDLVCFMEVKDYGVERRMRSNDDLATWVAQKVRDTISGIVGAHYRGGDGNDWKSHLSAWLGERRLAVVLWLEERPQSMDEMSVLTDVLKKKLRWLTTHVLVASLAAPLPGLGFKVKSLPGAGRPP